MSSPSCTTAKVVADESTKNKCFEALQTNSGPTTISNLLPSLCEERVRKYIKLGVRARSFAEFAKYKNMENTHNSTAEPEAVVTKEFLEQALKTSVEKIVVNPGSILGDGYTCVLYSVDVWKKGQSREDEPLHLLIKCFPTNPARQFFLEQGGLFPVELGMYDQVIPELIRFQESAQVERKISLPFAPFLAGQCVPKEERNGSTNPLDSYIIMTDLRKSGGFRLKDRFEGFDLDHYKLVVEAQATLHAFSWAYKCKTGTNFSRKFPFLNINGFANMMEQGGFEFFKANLRTSEGIVKDDPVLVDGVNHLSSVFMPAAKLYFNMELKEDEKQYTKDNVLRKPGPVVENEEPWEVLLHGDSWSNNMLFRYDQVTGKPVEVLLIDLQICREGDPFSDVNYTLFVSTNEDLRRKHLTSMLHVYYDTFTNVCNNFSVPTLPGWSWDEFNRRFHRAQMFGIYMAVSLLPLVLKNQDEIVDMENMKVSAEDMQSEDFMTSEAGKKLMEDFLSSQKENPVLKKRLGGVVADAVRAGVL